MRINTISSLAASAIGLMAMPACAQVVPDTEYQANYGLDVINPLPSYNLNLTGDGITVGVVDTGIDVTHQEFAGRISPLSHNFGTDGAPTDPSATGTDGHGTGVAGIIGAARNGVGMEGVAYRSTLVILRAIDTKTSDDETEDPTTTAIRYAAQLHLKVLNGSYGPNALPPKYIQDPGFPADPEKQIANPHYQVLSYQPIFAGADLIADYQAVKAAAAADVVLVFAAGNENTDQPVASASPDGVGLYPYITPANHNSGVYNLLAESITTVATDPATYQALPANDPLYQQADFADLKGALVVVVALAKDGTIADYSNRCGVAADWCLAAPGGSNTEIPADSIYSTNLGGSYSYQSGTSEATPFVSGAAAILRQEFPYLTAHQIIETILTTTTDLGSPLIYGQGLLNLCKAVGGPGKFRDPVFDVDTQGYNSTWSNDISGAGGLTKRGAGTLRLSGASIYAGSTVIASGTLEVDGSITSPTSITTGGILAGVGTVGAVTVGDHGIIAPGNGIGKLTVAGPISFSSGSTYRVEYAPASGADLIAVSGAATIAPGSTVALTRIGGTALKLGSRYAILTAAGGVNGTIAAIIGAATGLSFIDLGLSYDAQDVYLGVDRNAVRFASFATTPNQAAAAGALDTLSSTNAAYNTVVYLADGTQAGRLFDLASGEIHASIKTLELDDSRYIREGVLARLEAGSAQAIGATGVEGLWLQGVGSWGHYGSNGNAARGTQNSKGALGGFDFAWGRWQAGIAGGYRKTKLQVVDRASSAAIKNYDLSVYGGHAWGPLSLDVGLAQTWSKVNTRRSIVFGSLNDDLRSDYDAHTSQAFGEVGYFAGTDRAKAKPFVGLAYVRVHSDAFGESGGDAALTSSGENFHTTFLTAGARASFAVGGATSRFTVFGTGAWKHAFGGYQPTATLAFAGSSAFVVSGLPIARDAIVLDLGVGAQLARGFTVSANYNGQVARSAADNGARINASISF